MPTSRRSREGWPCTSAAASASARRASATLTHGPPKPSGRSPSETTPAAPCPKASSAKRRASTFAPRTATKSQPSRTCRESCVTSETAAPASPASSPPIARATSPSVKSACPATPETPSPFFELCLEKSAGIITRAALAPLDFQLRDERQMVGGERSDDPRALHRDAAARAVEDEIYPLRRLVRRVGQAVASRAARRPRVNEVFEHQPVGRTLRLVVK